MDSDIDVAKTKALLLIFAFFRTCKKKRFSYDAAHVNKKGADKLTHPRSLINDFVFRSLDSISCIGAH